MPMPFRRPIATPDDQDQRQHIDKSEVRAVDQARQEDAAEADGPGQRQIEPAGEDHRTLAQRQDRHEGGEHDQRVVVVPAEQHVADHELGGDQDEDEADIGRQREAQRLPVPRPEGRRCRCGSRRAGPGEPELVALAQRLPGQRPGPPRLQPPPALAQIVKEARAAAERGAKHRQDQDQPLDDRAVVGGDVQHEEDVDDDHQDVGAEDRARRPAAAAAEPGSAHHHRGEDLEQHGIADERVAAAGQGADEDAAQAVEPAGQRVDEEKRARQAQTGRGGRVRVAAGGIDRHAEAAVLQQQPAQQQQHDQDDRHRQEVGDRVAREDAAERGRDGAARLFHDEQRQALDDEHGREGDDDGLEPDIGDEEAVEGAAGGAGGDAEEAPEQDRPRRVLHVRGQHDIDQRDDGAGGEIETAREDHERLAHGGDREGGAAAREKADLEVGEGPGADPVGDQEQDDKDGDRDQEAAVAAEPEAPAGRSRASADRAGSGGHAARSRTASPPRAARRIASSLMAPWPSSSATRPP